LFVCILLFAAPCFATSNAEKLAETQKALQTTRAKADALALKVKLSERDMAGIRKRATELARAIQTNETALTRSERQLAALAGDVTEREARLTQRKAQSGQLMLAMLHARRIPTAALFAQPGNATTMLRTAAAMQGAEERLAADAAQLRQELTALRRSKEQLASTRTRAKEQAETLRTRQTMLDADLAKRSAADRQLRQDQQTALKEATRLAHESKSLQDLVNRVQAQPVTTGRFAGRGRLSAPVAGEVEHRFGEHKNANETYRGMEFVARPGAVVVAPAAGEVAFTGPFMDYGPMVLLRHADGYMSLLAGLGSIDARIGQQVGAGEPVGRMGGGNPRLYVELRERAKPIDPSGWFANVGKSLAAR